MPRSGRLFVVVALTMAFAACSKAPVAAPPPLEASAISAEALWRRISTEDPYRRYPPWPGHEGVRMGQAPHGSLHRIFVSPAILGRLPIGDRRILPGGTIVIENLDPESKLTSLDVMAKVQGFAPAGGDWCWARYDVEGKALSFGAVRSCLICHAGMKDNDYVIVRRLDAPLVPADRP